MQKKDHYDRIGLVFRKHWTLRYLFDRSKEFVYRKMNPDSPWLTPQAIRYIESVLHKNFDVLEFGSGRSTIWFSKRVGSILSFEDDRQWFEFVNESIKGETSNVKYILVDKSREDYDNHFKTSIRSLPDAVIDLCLIDGCPRGLCALESIPKVKRGGFIVVDNVNWFLPSESRSPSSIRLEKDIPNEFVEFHKLTSDWNRVWTSNGVTDTLILVKP